MKLEEKPTRNDENENTKIEQESHEKEGWVLTFHDDFEGDMLNLKKWEHAPEWERHLGHWSDENAFVNGEGQLIIRIDKRDGQYYS